jgi:hypothetical protein
MEQEIISTYSREQALEDGMLIDVSEMAKEANFKVPVAITRELWYNYIKPEEELMNLGQSMEGRLWDTLWMLLVKIKAGGANISSLSYLVYYLTSPRRKKLVKLWSEIGPGDNGEPVMTIMLPEDY